MSRKHRTEFEIDGQTNIFTDRVLQINVNFFTVQQSIDHTQIIMMWSMMQCRISKLQLP